MKITRFNNQETDSHNYQATKVQILFQKGMLTSRSPRIVGPPRSRTSRGRRGPAHRSYQGGRVEQHRRQIGREVQDELATQLKKSLAPGAGDAISILARLEAKQTLKAISITITTRSIGFSVTMMLHHLTNFDRCPNEGTCYTMYRVYVAALECHLMTNKREQINISFHLDRYCSLTMNGDFISKAKSILIAPDSIARIINGVGIVKAEQKVNIPQLAALRYTRAGRLIPDPGSVSYSNLRAVVEALASPETRRQDRLRFYQNNPIPGAIWIGDRDDPILANPNEIMPEHYTLDQGSLNFLAEGPH